MPPQTESKELLCPSNGIKLSANLALKGLLGKDKDSDKGKDRDRDKDRDNDKHKDKQTTSFYSPLREYNCLPTSKALKRLLGFS